MLGSRSETTACLKGQHLEMLMGIREVMKEARHDLAQVHCDGKEFSRISGLSTSKR